MSTWSFDCTYAKVFLSAPLSVILPNCNFIAEPARAKANGERYKCEDKVDLKENQIALAYRMRQPAHVVPLFRLHVHIAVGKERMNKGLGKEGLNS